MSLQHTQQPGLRPTPVVYDPLPTPGDEFRDAHNGVHSGPVRDRPRRPFHPTKCAHSSEDVLGMAARMAGEAHEFVEALLDVIEDNTGARPPRAVLQFTVNTGTPSQNQGWVFSVRLTSPINAAVKMVRGGDGAWEYVIERSSQRTRVRAGVDRPLHPRRHQDPQAGVPLPTPNYDHVAEAHPAAPEELHRNVEL